MVLYVECCQLKKTTRSFSLNWPQSHANDRVVVKCATVSTGIWSNDAFKLLWDSKVWAWTSSAIMTCLLENVDDADLSLGQTIHCQYLSFRALDCISELSFFGEGEAYLVASLHAMQLGRGAWGNLRSDMYSTDIHTRVAKMSWFRVHAIQDNWLVTLNLPTRNKSDEEGCSRKYQTYLLVKECSLWRSSTYMVQMKVFRLDVNAFFSVFTSEVLAHKCVWPVAVNYLSNSFTSDHFLHLYSHRALSTWS